MDTFIAIILSIVVTSIIAYFAWPKKKEPVFLGGPPESRVVPPEPPSIDFVFIQRVIDDTESGKLKWIEDHIGNFYAIRNKNRLELENHKGAYLTYKNEKFEANNIYSLFSAVSDQLEARKTLKRKKISEGY